MTGSPDEDFVLLSIKLVHSVHALTVFKVLGFLVKDKNNLKFLLACLHMQTQKVLPKARKNFCSGFPLLSLVDFLQVHIGIAGFQNNFLNHRRLSKQLVELQAAT